MSGEKSRRSVKSGNAFTKGDWWAMACAAGAEINGEWRTPEEMRHLRMTNNINPDHYRHGGVETVDFIEAKRLDYHLGNVVKYVARAGHKGDEIEDLQKALWYLRKALHVRGAGEDPRS